MAKRQPEGKGVNYICVGRCFKVLISLFILSNFKLSFPYPSIMLLALIVLIAIGVWLFWSRNSTTGKIPVSVNYHFTRQCNKSCGFCFHTATTSFRLDVKDAQRGLSLLKRSGMRKINFAGGEPFLYKTFLGTLVKFCKEALELESVSIVTNGSLVDRAFLVKYGRHIDILAVSCDSFVEETNIKIGRGSGDQIPNLFAISQLCKEFGIKFKLNTVVCRLNWNEDMNEHLSRLQPFRWKCFQVLMVAGENDSDGTLRDVRKFEITSEEFEAFCTSHRKHPCFVAESNKLMAKSYLILDEYMRFLDRDGRQPSQSILQIGVSNALDQIFWDEESFFERGGLYEWSKDKKISSCESSLEGNLEW